MKETAFAVTAVIMNAIGGGRLLRAFADRWAVVSGPEGARLERRRAPPFLVLIYHRVHPEPGPFMIDAIPPERFDRQMRHLARGYRPLPLEELRTRSEQGTLPRGAVAVTFDDGYADNYEHALPILRRHRIPATVFLVSGCIGTGLVPWHDQVLLAFQATRRDAVRPPGAEGGPPLPLDSVEARRNAAFRSLAALKPMPEAARLSAIASLREELGGGTTHADRSLMLDWNQVRAMRREGISFGSHTESHPILSRVTPERAREELERSKRSIEEGLGEACTLFAYPNGKPGDFSEENVAQVKAAGYRAALTTSLGANEAGDDPFRWRRGTPWEENPGRFALKLAYYRLRAAGGEA